MIPSTGPYAQAKKRTGVDDLFRDYVPQQLEEQKWLKAGNYMQLFKKYEQLLALDQFTPFNAGNDILNSYFDTVTEVLLPPVINAFLQTLERYEHRGRNHVDGAGLFISALVQNSYDAGNNDFTLETGQVKTLNYLGYSIHGILARPLVLTIEGELGDGFCYGAKYVHATAGGWGLAFFTDKSQHCRFTIDEYVFLEDWSVDDNCYKTTDHGTIKILKNNVPMRRNNKIMFIDKDGTEQLLRDS